MMEYTMAASAVYICMAATPWVFLFDTAMDILALSMGMQPWP